MKQNDSAAAPSAGWFISTFYFFKNLENLEQVEQDLQKKGDELGVLGLFILGHEGLNSTFSAPTAEFRAKFQEFVCSYFNEPNQFFKNSWAEIQPFPKFKVKIRPEIVTLGTPDLQPKGPHKHLSPEEWEKVLQSDEDYVIIDTRNSYEVGIGKFEGALDPKIEQFTDFPKFVDDQNIPKDKKMLIYCTGGIRCEKGLLELERRGYNNVFQLEGGILSYLEKFPNSKFEGECFVFDHRVAVTQELEASSTYKLCPHCGQPGSKKISCKRCDSDAVLCEKCVGVTEVAELCSKNCVHHTRMGHSLRGKPQIPLWRKPEQ